MNRIVLIIFLVISTHSFARQEKGDGVGNGAGLSENNFVFVYKNFSKYLQYAFLQPKLNFDQKELIILEKISKSLSKEYENKKQLQFINDPNTFKTPFPYERIAVTWDDIGSEIYINKNLLYQTTTGIPRVITISQVLSILLHEFGHHHGIGNGEDNEYFLNQLGAKVAGALLNKIEKRNLNIAPNIYAQYINFNKNSFATFKISDGRKFIDLSSALKNESRCPYSMDELIGVKVWQAHWTRNARLKRHLKLELFLYCSDGSKVRAYGGAEFIVVPTLAMESNVLRIKSTKFGFHPCDPRRGDYCESKNKQAQNYLDTKTFSREEK
ncbi:MAG: hypothetical protein HON90_08860 [Halobacteriovoraceae bacterium]|jgi:hypothetical protein|nr:hypothetical protein [Halobacteriovoraceae bacterium]